MRLTLALLLAVGISSALAAGAAAQDLNPEWFDLDPLPKEMTPEEELRRHEIGMTFERTAPPASSLRNIAEFERNEAALIRWPLGVPLALVAAMSEHARVVTLVSSSWQQTQATSAYQGAGVNMENVDFLLASTNSIWTRDYGPFYGVTDGGEVSIVDFIYNRPRPLDDQIAGTLANHLDVPYYGMDLVHTGGNYMTDGWGYSASTDTLLMDNDWDEAYVLDTMNEFLGIDHYHITIDPQAPSIGHIDTWAKFLDVDKIMIVQVPPSHPHHGKLEPIAAYFENQLSPWGTPYQVFRVYAPSGEPYTNSLILNERVYVPLWLGSNWNEAALDSYRDALPGYEVLGFFHTSGGMNLWHSGDALHCRVKEIPDLGMLSILHLPVTGTHPASTDHTLLADIAAHSGEDLVSSSLQLHYSINGMPFESAPLAHVTGETYFGALPIGIGDVEVAYYFEASDESGRTETYPLVGAPGARTFTIEHDVVEQDLAAGWHMVSLPLARSHTHFSQVFEGATALLANGSGGYESVETLSTSGGYWMHLEEGLSLSFAGTPIDGREIEIVAGWNLIAAAQQPLDAGAITDPEGLLIDGTIYGFDDNYARSTTLAPGRGHWVRAGGEGVITLTAGGETRSGAVDDLPYETFHGVHLSAGAAAFSLFMGADLDGFPGDIRSFGLPPAPPAGLFDARFADDTWLTGTTQAFIDLQNDGQAAELLIEAPEGFGAQYRLALFNGSELIDERTVASGEVTLIEQEVDGLEIEMIGEPTDVEDGGTPPAFDLAQNYPNPAGASTRIEYAVAEAADVRIEVFNVAGQRVATLVDTPHAPGTYSVTLASDALASGMYVYRMTSGSFVANRRLTVVR